MKTFWKHRDVLFNKKYKSLFCSSFPNILFFQFIIPSFSPLSYFFILICIFTVNAVHILLYY